AEAAEARDAESAARFFGRGSDGARGDIQSGRIQEADRKDGAECTAGIRETFAILGKGDGPAMTTDRLCEGRIGFAAAVEDDGHGGGRSRPYAGGFHVSLRQVVT